MRKKIWLVAIFILPFYFSPTVFCVNKLNDSLQFKRACLSSTVKAIQLEIERYEVWIENAKLQKNSEKELEYQITIDSLKKDLNTFQKMKDSDYVLPLKRSVFSYPSNIRFTPQLITTTAWVEEAATDNTVLYVEGMSKSGPWFHLAGIVENDYSVLKPKVKYKITFYTVYGCNYWNMTSAYVCVVLVNK